MKETYSWLTSEGGVQSRDIHINKPTRMRASMDKILDASVLRRGDEVFYMADTPAGPRKAKARVVRVNANSVTLKESGSGYPETFRASPDQLYWR